MDLSIEELKLINEVLIKAKAQSETGCFEFEKQILDSCKIASNENIYSNVQGFYDRLLNKIENAMKETIV